MPKRAEELGALAVKRLTAPGLFAVGGVTGLALQVKPTGARSWILRITTVGGQRREIGLGGYPDISLATARDLARRMRELIANGVDPVEKRRSDRATARALRTALTFKEAAERWRAMRLPEYKNPKYAAQVLTTLQTYAVPSIGAVPVRDIQLRHVLDVLEPIWTTKTETADRIRVRMLKVL